MKLIKTLFALVLVAQTALAANDSKKTTLVSPDGRLKVTAVSGNSLTWSIDYDGMAVVEPSAIGITIDGKEAIRGKAKAGKTVKVDRNIGQIGRAHV